MNLIKILNADFQTNESIYSLINDFYVLLNKKDWLKNYIFWELKLLKILGYDIDFKNLVDKKLIKNKLKYITKSFKEKKIVPNFLIDKELKVENLDALLDGLNLISNFLDKTILKPNNINHPVSRLQFIASLK